MLLFLILFVSIPLVELFLLIRVGSFIGALPTIGLALLTAAIGVWLVRMQGLAVLMRVRAMLERGETPALELLDGAVLLVCGFMLLLPGFFTDTVGFLLLVPTLRHALIRRYIHVIPVPPIPGQPSSRDSGPRVIEGDFRREDD